MKVRTKEYFIAVGLQARKVKLHVRRWYLKLRRLFNMFLPLWAQQPAFLLWRLLKITHYCNGQAHIFLTIMSILF